MGKRSRLREKLLWRWTPHYFDSRRLLARKAPARRAMEALTLTLTLALTLTLT